MKTLKIQKRLDAKRKAVIGDLRLKNGKQQRFNGHDWRTVYPKGMTRVYKGKQQLYDGHRIRTEYPKGMKRVYKGKQQMFNGRNWIDAVIKG